MLVAKSQDIHSFIKVFMLHVRISQLVIVDGTPDMTALQIDGALVIADLQYYRYRLTDSADFCISHMYQI